MMRIDDPESAMPPRLSPPQPAFTGQYAPVPPANPFYSSPGASTTDIPLTPMSALAPPRAYRDYSLPQSATSSRRASFESSGTRDSRLGFLNSPYGDSRAHSREGSDEDINTQTVAQKYNIMPSPDLLLFPEDVEKDDYLHNPDPNEPDRDKCQIWSTRGWVNIGGLVFITVGVLALFIALPLLYVPRYANILFFH